MSLRVQSLDGGGPVEVSVRARGGWSCRWMSVSGAKRVEWGQIWKKDMKRLDETETGCSFTELPGSAFQSKD